MSLLRSLVRLTLAVALIGGSAHAQDAGLRIAVQSPRDGETVRNRVHLAPVKGTASASGDVDSAYDVMVVIDVSKSTECASGVDVDGDGEFGVNPEVEGFPTGSYPKDMCSTDPDDSILAAELKAARSLISGLDMRRVRLGVLTFSGDTDPETGKRLRADQQDAELRVALSSDPGAALAALDRIAERGPHGATNFAAGIRLAITELAGLTGARSQARSGARRIALFLTDGVPSFPIGLGTVSDPGDVEAAITAARLAHTAGVRINSYAIGPAALTQPIAVTEIAKATRGTLTPVRNPGDIIAVLQSVSFANVEDVVVTNLTTGDFSTDVELTPDGSFSGFVPVREGSNRLRVTALAADGTQGSVEIEIQFAMAELTDRELARDLERIRARNRELKLLLERKKIEDFRRQEQQRKEIEIHSETPPTRP